MSSASDVPGTGTCLIVDDSRIVRQIARRILEALGFIVTTAENGQEALDACRRAMPGLILLDWNMAVMNGIDFLCRLRAVEGGEAPVVVFCTTVSDIARIREAIIAGANDYIIKPFDADLVRQKLAALGVLQTTASP